MDITWEKWLKEAEGKDPETFLNKYLWPYYEDHIRVEALKVVTNSSHLDLQMSPRGYFSVGQEWQNEASEGSILQALKSHVSTLYFENISPVVLQAYSEIDFNILKVFSSYQETWTEHGPFLCVIKSKEEKILREYWKRDHLCFDSEAYIQRGASPALEIALLLSEFFAACEGRDALSLAKHSHFIIYNQNHFFTEIAKMRAFHYLWQKFFAFQGKLAPTPNIHVRVAPHLYADQDIHNNILRMGSVGFSAILGGASSCSLKNFDSAVEKHYSYSERLSRNLLLILSKESHLDFVNDTAKGSFYLEDLSYKLAEKAWMYLQSIDAAESLFTYLNDTPDFKILKKERDDRLTPIIGVNTFVNAGEDKK